MIRARAYVAAVAALGVAAGLSGCGSADTSSQRSPNAKSITVWSLEEQPDRLAKAQADATAFTKKTGIAVKLTGVNEDQFPQLITAAAASGKLPDVVGALPLAAVRTMSGNDLVSTAAAGAVIKDLGAGTFSPSALSLTRDGKQQLAVPSDGFPLSVIYRKDVFAKAGLAPPTTYATMLAAAKKLDSPQMAGFVAGDSPSTSYTQQVFEFVALANGCQLVDDAAKVTLDSKACVDAFNFYGDLTKNYSVPGAMDSTSTKTTYMAGKAAMTIWASFILDEMAGLVNDAKPTCPQCTADPTFIAKNSGFVTSLQGPDAQSPVTGGDVTSWVITSSAATDSAKKFVEYFMGDGYLPWLDQAPEGKFPTRHGTAQDPQTFVDGWKTLSTGVDTKAKLSDIYAPDVLAHLQTGVDTFTRWGFTQGQGNLVGAVLTELPIPKAIGSLASGDVDGKGAAQQAAKAVQGIKDSTQ
jgi:multiple sugar transport system substrate-binding protein